MPEEQSVEKPKSRTSEEILLKSLGQFSDRCEALQHENRELENQVAVLLNRLSEFQERTPSERADALELEVERLRQENAVLKMKLEDSQL